MASLSTDDWQGVRSGQTTTPDATWDDVEAALRALDGKRRTQLMVEHDDTSNIVVGGGAGAYNVCITTADEIFYTLRDRSKQGTTELVAGGQRGVYPAETVVDLDMAQRAVRVFYELGLADATLDWRET